MFLQKARMEPYEAKSSFLHSMLRLAVSRMISCFTVSHFSVFRQPMIILPPKYIYRKKNNIHQISLYVYTRITHVTNILMCVYQNKKNVTIVLICVYQNQTCDKHSYFGTRFFYFTNFWLDSKLFNIIF